jgi:hypothetical protein
MVAPWVRGQALLLHAAGVGVALGLLLLLQSVTAGQLQVEVGQVATLLLLLVAMVVLCHHLRGLLRQQGVRVAADTARGVLLLARLQTLQRCRSRWAMMWLITLTFGK